jgi:hypothetical protein
VVAVGGWWWRCGGGGGGGGGDRAQGAAKWTFLKKKCKLCTKKFLNNLEK